MGRFLYDFLFMKFFIYWQAIQLIKHSKAIHHSTFKHNEHRLINKP